MLTDIDFCWCLLLVTIGHCQRVPLLPGIVPGLLVCCLVCCHAPARPPPKVPATVLSPSVLPVLCFEHNLSHQPPTASRQHSSRGRSSQTAGSSSRPPVALVVAVESYRCQGTLNTQYFVRALASYFSLSSTVLDVSVSPTSTTHRLHHHPRAHDKLPLHPPTQIRTHVGLQKQVNSQLAPVSPTVPVLPMLLIVRLCH